MAVIESDRIGFAYLECESCRNRNLLRPVTLDDETYYVCEDCTPQDKHDSIW